MRISTLLFPLAVFTVQFATARNIIPSDVNQESKVFPKSMVFLGSVEGKSYFADKTEKIWYDANVYCNSFNMKLATITSVGQRNVLQNLNSDSFHRYHWIGAFESRKATELAWDETRNDLSASVFPDLYNEADVLICGAIDVFLSPGYLDLTFALCSTRKQVLCEA